LFFYDIFWVFFTPVMVTVAKSFDAPIKLVWPKDVSQITASGWMNLFRAPEKGVAFTMLGLGDIVIPGIFIALALRFDVSRLDRRRPYFRNTLIAYVVGLVTTVLVMHTFQAAQPALLYLSPACILAVLGTAWQRGEVKDVFAYNDDKEEKEVVSLDHVVRTVNDAKKSTSANNTQDKGASDTQAKPAPAALKGATQNGAAQNGAKGATQKGTAQNGLDKPLNNRQRRALKRQESASSPQPIPAPQPSKTPQPPKKAKTQTNANKEAPAQEVSAREMAAAFLKNKAIQ